MPVTLAFELTSGAKLWQKDFQAPVQVENTNYTSKAAPTPVVEDSGVVCLFEGGLLVAVNHQGHIRWERNLVDQYGPVTSRHGLGSSLAKNEELVFIWVERQESPYLLAVQKDNGMTRWKVDGLGGASWSTPVMLTVGDQQHLVLSGSGVVAGFDPANGERLWSLKLLFYLS